MRVLRSSRQLLRASKRILERADKQRGETGLNAEACRLNLRAMRAKSFENKYSDRPLITLACTERKRLKLVAAAVLFNLKQVFKDTLAA